MEYLSSGLFRNVSADMNPLPTEQHCICQSFLNLLVTVGKFSPDDLHCKEVRKCRPDVFTIFVPNYKRSCGLEIVFVVASFANSIGQLMQQSDFPRDMLNDDT
jgi:hypothetical protein